ncbi:pilus assembly protein TadG-related protein [Jiella sonneratiae]|uniref:VWA domain-containing protein n=1 Tax=Jiella sonneratiae TaxID=2816856 RepID=A0ABS3J0C7_9HYPH|nr:pilus assembly protein TadG-related protein [Jiella sonneratiae]MBO0903134.1 VWA domain-containing protein [Jiella sonneratiae]
MSSRPLATGSLRRLAALARRFRHSSAGNFGMMTGLTAVPLLIALGGAVDYSNALREKTSVQAAADAAALTAAKYSGSDETERLSRANMYFSANIDPDITVGSTSLSKVDGSWVYDADFSMPTAFLGLMHIDALDMSVKSEVKQADTPLDIVLVLDSTGSMASNGKMTQLQAAVKLFLDSFDGATGIGKVQVAMIPFDTEVKIQSASMTMLSTPTATCSYMSSPDKSYCSTTAAGFVLGTTGTYLAGYSSSAKRYIGYVYTAADTPAQMFTVTRVTYSCSNSNYTSCTTSTSTVYNRSLTKTKVTGSFTGCIIDRLQPYDTQSDAATASTVDTLYTRSYDCSASSSLQPVVGLTEDLDTVETAVTKLTPSGNTNISIGVQWGMEALTSDYPLQGANTDARAKKIMIVLTDGDNTKDRWYDSSASSSIDARTELACSKAKAMTNADGTVLELYTIRVIDGNETLLKSCATDEGHYYPVTTASQLSAVFQDIAERVKRIRIVS